MAKTNRRHMLRSGREVRILATDSDPSCLTWICFVDNPDEDALVKPGDILEIVED